MGRTEFLTWKTITSEPRLEKATPSTRAKWRSSLSACSSVLTKCLTRADIVRAACFRHSGATSTYLTSETATPNYISCSTTTQTLYFEPDVSPLDVVENFIGVPAFARMGNSAEAVRRMSVGRLAAKEVGTSSPAASKN
jgi:hypothetical protein